MFDCIFYERITKTQGGCRRRVHGGNETAMFTTLDSQVESETFCFRAPFVRMDEDEMTRGRPREKSINTSSLYDELNQTFLITVYNRTFGFKGFTHNVRL